MRSVRTRGLFAMLVVLACVSGGSRTQGASGPEVRVRTVDAEDVAGAVESFSLEDGLVLQNAAAAKTKVAAGDVVQIDTGLRRRPADPQSIYWVLATGDAVYGRLVAGTARTISIRRDDLGTLDLPLAWLRELITPAGRALRDSGGSRRVASRPAAEDDELRLANGDRLSGLIGRIDPNGVTLETADGPTVVGFDVLLTARLAQVNRPASPSAGNKILRARVSLRDGSTLTVADLRWRGDELAVRMDGDPGRAERRLRIEHVLRVEILGGRWQWLGYVQPVVAEHTPLLDVRWPHRIDRNVLGGPIRIGGRRFQRGIGVHSRSRLVYRLDDRCQRFVSRYGLDDESGPMAHVEVKVLLDGKRVHHVPDVRADGQIRQVSIDLNGARQIELLVDFGKNGDVQDRFDWIEPAIIRR